MTNILQFQIETNISFLFAFPWQLEPIEIYHAHNKAT